MIVLFRLIEVTIPNVHIRILCLTREGDDSLCLPLANIYHSLFSLHKYFCPLKFLKSLSPLVSPLLPLFISKSLTILQEPAS